MKWIELPKSDKKLWRFDAARVGVALAAVMALVLIAQLFHFEKVPIIFDDYGMMGLLVAAVIVAAELLSLPFLTSLKVSPLMRGVSALLSVLAPFWWWGWGVYLTYHEGYMTGILGATVSAPVGLGYIWLTTFWLIIALLLVVTVYVPSVAVVTIAKPSVKAVKKTVTHKKHKA